MKKYMYLIIIGLLLISCNKVEVNDEERINNAVAVLHPINDSNVSGIIYFKDKRGVIEVIADVNGLERGNHGFHIHAFGDLSEDDGGSTGSIYDPQNKIAGKGKGNRLPGNLGNIYSLDQELAQYKQDLFSLSLNGENSIIGRSVVVHQNEDDYKSLPCGNSGQIIAAGIIGIANN